MLRLQRRLTSIDKTKLKPFSLSAEQSPICIVSTEELIRFLQRIISNEVSGHKWIYRLVLFFILMFNFFYPTCLLSCELKTISEINRED